MSPLTTDNRDMVEVETELRARIDAQRRAIETVQLENRTLREENRVLNEKNRRLEDLLKLRSGASYESDPAEPRIFRPMSVA